MPVLRTGSLTGLAFLVALAWAIRMLRKKQNTQEGKEGENGIDRKQPTLDSSSMAMLIETDPIPHYIIDVRERERAVRHPLPDVFRRASGGFMNIPVGELRRMFLRRDSGDFSGSFPDVKFPLKEDLIIFISDDIEESKKAVDIVHSIGFTCAVYLENGLESLQGQMPNSDDMKNMSRHAVAVLLGLTDFPAPVEATVIDLRRADEHVVYGTIEGTKHLPMSEMLRALNMEEDEFFGKYQFHKPQEGDVVVLTCRTKRRASWAAQIMATRGFKKVFVHKTGAYGWRFNPNVKVYDSYEKGDEFPEPKQFTPEVPDQNAGLQELVDAGLVSPPKAPRPLHLRTTAPTLSSKSMNSI